MTRDQALQLVKKHVKNKNLIKHMLAVEAIMRALAIRFGENAELWGLAGLLHDIDYDQTADEPAKHSQLGADMLAQEGLDPTLVYAVRAHNEMHGLPLKNLMDKSLFAADPLSGLIVAAALIHPDRKLAVIDTPFITNRFNEKSFARGANREQIQTCHDMGLTLEQFVSLALRSMQGISADLGL